MCDLRPRPSSSGRPGEGQSGCSTEDVAGKAGVGEVTVSGGEVEVVAGIVVVGDGSCVSVVRGGVITEGEEEAGDIQSSIATSG